jgi:hypothetical protein
MRERPCFRQREQNENDTTGDNHARKTTREKQAYQPSHGATYHKQREETRP